MGQGGLGQADETVAEIHTRRMLGKQRERRSGFEEQIDLPQRG